MDRFTALTVFAQVADSLSFSAAAKQLGLTPSAVSKQIAQLEDRLGARLVQRTTRKLALTEAGTAFLPHARQILGALEDAEAAVTNLAEAPRGVLRVSLPTNFAQMHVGPVLPAFLARYPEVRLEVSITDRFIDLVQEGIDVAVRIGALNDSTLVARRLAPNRRVVAAAPGYLDRHGRPAVPRDLLTHNCLIYGEPGRSIAWVFNDGSERITVPVGGSLRCNDTEVLLKAALAGAGIVRMSTYVLVDALAAGRLVPLLPTYEVQESEVYAVYPAGRHLSPKVRVFIDHLVETVGRPGYWRAAGLA